MEHHFIGNAPSICKIRELIKLVSDTPFSVMKEEGDSPADEREKPVPVGDQPASPTLLEIKAMATKNIERQAILRALKNTGWKKRAAAKMLRISHKALYYKMEDLGIRREEDGARSRKGDALNIEKGAVRP